MLEKVALISAVLSIYPAFPAEPSKHGLAKSAPAAAAGNAGQGKIAFTQQCASCHDKGVAGPVLMGVFKRKRMADKKTRMSADSVRNRIVGGGNGMPPFASLNAKQVDDLIAYLKTL